VLTPRRRKLVRVRGVLARLVPVGVRCALSNLKGLLRGPWSFAAAVWDAAGL